MRKLTSVVLLLSAGILLGLGLAMGLSNESQARDRIENTVASQRQNEEIRRLEDELVRSQVMHRAATVELDRQAREIRELQSLARRRVNKLNAIRAVVLQDEGERQFDDVEQADGVLADMK